MQRIKSFQRDHIVMEAGLYLQETKRFVDIYDLRFVKPNTEFIPIEAIHTIEHLFATWLKTHDNRLKDFVISFYPGGCQTMFYLELFDFAGFCKKAVANVLIECIDWCLEQDEVPGATEKECGNYKSHDLCKAKEWLTKYRAVLNEVE